MTRPLGDIYWLGVNVFVSFNSLTLLGRCQEWQQVHENPLPLISKGSLPKQMEEENGGETGKSRLTWNTAAKTEVSVGAIRYY